MKKYEFTETKNDQGLYQIRALINIPIIGIKVGDLGGWIETENNLSHTGDCWVHDNGQVSGNGRVCHNMHVHHDIHIITSVTSINRSDGYTFYIGTTQNGEKRIMAGCRCFTYDEAVEHWTKTRGGSPLGDETMEILDFLKKRTESIVRVVP